MKPQRGRFFFSSVWLAVGLASIPRVVLACQSGVADGSVTADGRPLSWKCREFAWSPNYLVYYPAGGDSDGDGVPDRYGYVAVIDPARRGGSFKRGEEVRQGINTAGLSASHNASSRGNLGWPNAHFLAAFSSLAQVRQYIGTTGIPEPSIYFVTDASGSVSVWEISDRTRAVFEYPPLAPARETQTVTTSNGPVSRLGFVVRFNSPTQDRPYGMDNTGDTYPEERPSGVPLIASCKAAGNLSAKTLWQGCSGAAGRMDAFGFMRNQATANHVGGTVVLGVHTNEDPRLTTMFTALGYVRYSIAIPVWSIVTNLPPTMSHSGPDCFANIVGGHSSTNGPCVGLFGKFDFRSSRVWPATLPMEAKFFDMVTGRLLPEWRKRNWSDPREVDRITDEMTRVENQMAADAYSLLAQMLRGPHPANRPPLDSGIGGIQVHGRTATFSGLETDSDGRIARTLWNYGDGTTGEAATHTYAVSGRYLISFTATDNDGVSYTDWTYIDIR